MTAESGNACDEVIGLGRLIAQELGDLARLRETDVALALRASLAGDPASSSDVAAWIARWIHEHGGAGNSVVQLSNRAAFLSLTLRESSSLSVLVRRLALRAYLGTAGALQPFVEKEDFFELVRWRLWSVPTRRFDSDGILRSDGLAAFVATVCRHLAIDQLRRLASRRTEPIGDGTHSAEAPDADLEAQIEAYEEIERAVEVAGSGQPGWVVRGAIAVLSESRDRAEVLSEINRQRVREGDEPWTPGAFNTFLYRFRRRLREALRGQDRY